MRNGPIIWSLHGIIKVRGKLSDAGANFVMLGYHIFHLEIPIQTPGTMGDPSSDILQKIFNVEG